MITETRTSTGHLQEVVVMETIALATIAMATIALGLGYRQIYCNHRERPTDNVMYDVETAYTMPYGN